jgi:hypothetical protein
MLAGALVLGGLAVVMWWLVPADPDLGDVLARLSPARATSVRVTISSGEAVEMSDRLGLWLVHRLPEARLRVPAKDLAILGRPTYVFYGEKLLLVLIVAVAGPLLGLLFWLLFGVPVIIPAGLTVVAAALVWFLPNREVAAKAHQARMEFSRALGAYVDLVALDRRAGGSGTRQAMENAAAIGQSWPFRRISDALARSRFAGNAPWDALQDLAEELGLPDLDDLADVMRMSGEEGAQVYEALRAQASSLRHAMLAAEKTQANELGERMVFPTTAMGLVFAAIIIGPGIMRLIAG